MRACIYGNIIIGFTYFCSTCNALLEGEISFFTYTYVQRTPSDWTVKQKGKVAKGLALQSPEYIFSVHFI